MICKDYAEMIISELCGEIEDEKKIELEAHLETCQECRKQQSEFRAIFGVVRQLPRKEWDEKLRIKDMLRRDQKWRTIVFSKAALWVIMLSVILTSLTYLPIRWDLSAHSFSVRWGKQPAQDADVAGQVKNLRQEIVRLQTQNQKMYQLTEARMKQLVDENNVAQQKQYFHTLEMFSSYMQLQHQADYQKLQRQIASSYDRTGAEMEKTNELLDYVLKASATDTVGGQ